MAQTVAEVLSAATDSVTVINDINTNGTASDHVSASDLSAGVTQADANAAVKSKRRSFIYSLGLCTSRRR